MVTKIGTCSVDGQMFHYDAPSWYGKGRTLCDEHRDQRRRAQTSQRVKRHRMNAKKTKSGRVVVVHIASCNGKTFCGRDHDALKARFIAENIKNGMTRGTICKSCYRAFVAETGGAK